MGSKCCSPGAVTSSRSAQEQEGGAPDRVPWHGMWAAQELKPVTTLSKKKLTHRNMGGTWDHVTSQGRNLNINKGEKFYNLTSIQHSNNEILLQ